jgi:microcystin-dependent protein
MSIVVPPDCDVAIFNPSCFDIQTTTIGGGVNIPYLFYPTAQGDNTMLRTGHQGVATFQNFAVMKNAMYDSNGLGGNNGDVFTSRNAPFQRTEWSPPLSLIGGALVGSVIPVVIETSAPPTGYLWCDGGSYLQTAYTALFAVIGLTYTIDAPVGYFQVPNFVRRQPIGSSALTPIGVSYNGTTLPYGGNYAMLDNQMYPHSHTISYPTSNTNQIGLDFNKTDNTTINNTGQFRIVSCNRQPLPLSTYSQPPYVPSNGPFNESNFNYTADHFPLFTSVNWLIKT